MLPHQFTTKRLRAYRISSKHEESLGTMHADERIGATLGGPRSQAQNQTYMQRNFIHWEKNGYGIWTFFATDDQLIGRGGLLYFDLFGDSEVELNYSVVADCWGQGYATEMARKILEVGFAHLDVGSIVAFTLATNKASQRVMQKVGMTFERNFINDNKKQVFYRKMACHFPT